MVKHDPAKQIIIQQLPGNWKGNVSADEKDSGDGIFY
jgi:hypothetical protein